MKEERSSEVLPKVKENRKHACPGLQEKSFAGECAVVADVVNENQPVTITKIAKLQRMGIEELNVLARQYGVKNIGSLTKSQVVFEIVKAKSERSDELLIGEGFWKFFLMGLAF